MIYGPKGNPLSFTSLLCDSHPTPLKEWECSSHSTYRHPPSFLLPCSSRKTINSSYIHNPFFPQHSPRNPPANFLLHPIGQNWVRYPFLNQSLPREVGFTDYPNQDWPSIEKRLKGCGEASTVSTTLSVHIGPPQQAFSHVSLLYQVLPAVDIWWAPQDPFYHVVHDRTWRVCSVPKKPLLLRGASGRQ